MNGRTGRNVAAWALIAALSGVGLASPAFGQATPVPAGTLTARIAEESNARRDSLSPPVESLAPPPASCGVPICLALELAPDALDRLSRGADAEEIADAVRFAHEGAQTAVHFTAARYERGRLAAYYNTDWIRPEQGSGQQINGVADAISRALAPLLADDVRIGGRGRDTNIWTAPVSVQSFLATSPRTLLIGGPEEAALDQAAAPAELADYAAQGAVMLLTMTPTAKTMRGADRVRVTGVVIPLQIGD